MICGRCFRFLPSSRYDLIRMADNTRTVCAAGDIDGCRSAS